MQSRTRPGTILALCTALLLPLSACGPTAEQLAARSASPSPAAQPARTPAAPSQEPVRPAPPVPEPASEPARVGVAGSQAGMPEAVQEACQWLLRRDSEPWPGSGAGACVSTALTAAGGGVQSLQTSTSWLPGGEYSVRFSTSPGFSMILQGNGLGIDIRDDRRVLQQGKGDIVADPGGSPEQAYAAVLADAAELTVRPERLAALLEAAGQVEVEYGAVENGSTYTRITGSFAASDSEEDTGSAAVIPEGRFTLDLDDYYRPVRIEISGLNQGIPSQLTAVNSQWGTQPRS